MKIQVYEDGLWFMKYGGQVMSLDAETADDAVFEAASYHDVPESEIEVL